MAKNTEWQPQVPTPEVRERSLWSRIKWQLTGEPMAFRYLPRIVTGIVAVIEATFWTGVGYLVVHFVIKYW